MFEPLETALFERLVKPGRTVLDIGAHIGYFTLLFARGIGPTARVIAFEAAPANLRLLSKNLQINRYSNGMLANSSVWNDRPRSTSISPG